jgi:hypothetical protein
LALFHSDGHLAHPLLFGGPTASRGPKGYTWYLWTIACGFLGLIVLAFLPYANKPDVSPEINLSRRQMGNTIGAVLSVAGLFGILFQVMTILADK